MSSLVTSMSNRAKEEHGQAGLKTQEIAISATHAELHKEILSLVPSLRAYARVLTCNQSDIDDLVQDTLVKGDQPYSSVRPGYESARVVIHYRTEPHYTAHQRRRQRAAIPLDGDYGPSVAPNQG